MENTEKNKLNSAVEHVCRLTPLQEGMLFHNQYKSKSTYVIQNVMKISGMQNVDHLIRAFEILTGIHEILRAVIITEHVDQPLLVIPKERKPEIRLESYTNDTDFRLFIEKDKERGITLDQDPLFRVCLFKVSQNEYNMLVTYSHIIVDGWSYAIIMNDLTDIYTGLCDGKLPDELLAHMKNDRKRLKYADYANWIRHQDTKTALQYWRNRLDGYVGSASIAAMGAGAADGESYETVKLQFSDDMTRQMEHLCRQLRITMNTFMETVWGLALQAYTNTDDVVFGRVSMGRSCMLAGIEQLVGLCINTIPARVTAEKNGTIKDLLIKHHALSLEGLKYDYCSLAEIQSALGQSSDLIKTIFIYEDLDDERRLNNSKGQIQIESKDTIQETTYDISIYAEAAESVLLICRYNAQMYQCDEMQKVLDRYQYMTEQILNNPQMLTEEIEFVLPEEKEKILHTFNKIYEREDHFVPVPQMLKKRAAEYGQRPALYFQEKQMSYAELDHLSDLVAKNLIANGIGNSDYVAVIAKRGFEMFTAIYGILKAGAAYVPIDDEYPKERMEYILTDAKCRFALVVRNQNINRGIKQLLIDDLYTEQKDTALPASYDLSAVAYLIYTSGTTGRPNGVMVTNRNVVNYCIPHAHNVYGGILQEENHVIACVTTISFDIFVTEIFLSLLNGMTVAIASEEQQNDGDLLCDFVERYQIDSLQITPSRIKLMLQSRKAYKLSGIKKIMIGGEPLSTAVCKNIGRYTNAELFNVYGPSETTVWSTYGKADKLDYDGYVPIGKPIRNTKVFISNKNGRLCGIGMPGEICIQGSGVAVGYLGNQELTQKRFCVNHWDCERTYHTGDLGYWRKDGSLQCIGRMDDQVKIRGIRIETEEIEKKIREISPDIVDVRVVLRKKEEEEFLCAYYVAGQEADTVQLGISLQQSLHKAVIPLFFRLDRLPLNANGKFDKKQLPDLQITVNEEEEALNQMESELAEMFADVLKLEKVGLRDNFFALGGHSLKVMRLMNQIEKKYGVRISIKEFFEHATVSEVESCLRSKMRTERE